MYVNPLAFDLVTAAEFDKIAKDRMWIVNSNSNTTDICVNTDKIEPSAQPPYMFGATQLEISIKPDTDYYIVPSLYKRNQPGVYYLSVYSNTDFVLEATTTSDLSAIDQKPMVVGPEDSTASAVALGTGEDSNNTDGLKIELSMSRAQYFEKKEQLREKLVTESKRLKITLSALEAIFNDFSASKGGRSSETPDATGGLTKASFKRRLMDIGFNLADFPDEDLIVLDADNSGTISPQEFLAFFKEGLEFLDPNSLTNIGGGMPTAPVDDLMFQTIDMEGVLSVKVRSARDLRAPVTWFDKQNATSSAGGESNHDSLSKLLALDSVLLQNMIDKLKPVAAKLSRLETIVENEAPNANSAALSAASGAVPIGTEVSGSNGHKQSKSESSAISIISHILMDKESRMEYIAEQKKMEATVTGGPADESITDGNQVAESAINPTPSVKSMGAASDTRRATMLRLGREAASKLHLDASLQKAEVGRTSLLGSLKSSRKNQVNNSGSEGKVDPSSDGVMLRRKTQGVSKLDNSLKSGVNVYSIINHPHVCRWLGYHPERYGILSPLQMTALFDKHLGTNRACVALDSGAPITVSAACTPIKASITTANGDVASTNGTKPEKNVPLSTSDSLAVDSSINKGTDPMSPGPLMTGAEAYTNPADDSSSNPIPKPKLFSDIWDELIDTVITISNSKSKRYSATISSIKSAISRGKLSAVDVHNIQDNFMLPTASMAASRNGTSRLATPTNKSHIPTSNGSSGSRATPKNLRKTPGTASVTTAKQQRGGSRSMLNKDVAHEVQKGVQKLINGNPMDTSTGIGDLAISGSYDLLYKKLVQIPVIDDDMLTGSVASVITTTMNAANVPSNDGNISDISRANASATIDVSGIEFNDNGTANIGSINQHSEMDELSLLRKTFMKFDKNLDGGISEAEFDITMREFNIDMSEEEIATLFNRLDVEGDPEDRRLSWSEFVSFYKLYGGSILKHGRGRTTSRPDKEVLVSESLPKGYEVVIKLYELKSVLSQYCEKELKRINALRKMNANTDTGKKDTIASVPDNAFFDLLTPEYAADNVLLLKNKLHFVISKEIMIRISRIFDSDLHLLMQYVQDPLLTADQLILNVNQTKLDMMREYGGRFSSCYTESTKGNKSSKKDSFKMSSNDVVKVWGAMTSALYHPCHYEAVCKYTNELLKDSSTFKPIDAYDSIYSRVVVDAIIYSPWNKVVTEIPGVKSSTLDSGSVRQNLYHCGMEAFLRPGHIQSIEEKLSYCMTLEQALNRSSMYCFVYVFVNCRSNEMLTVLYDPLSSVVMYHSFIQPEVGLLPSVSYHMGTGPLFSNGRVKLSDLPLLETYEYSLLNHYVSRIRLLRASSVSGSNVSLDAIQCTPFKSIVIAEDVKFVDKLKKLLQVVISAPTSKQQESLPFFCIISDICVNFQADLDSIERSGSLQKLVFSRLRSNAALYNFLTNSTSTLRINLASYNGGQRICMPWKEMVSYLTGYRNPFYTVQLLPEHIPCSRYHYTMSNNVGEAFSGDDSDEEGEEDEEDMLAVAKGNGVRKPKHITLQKGLVDQYGGCHPSFDLPKKDNKPQDHSLKFTYRPPKLSNCKVLFNEIAKVKVDGTWKYLIIMVREGVKKVRGAEQGSNGKKVMKSETFIFLTAYDSRTAAEYQCGVKAGTILESILGNNPVPSVAGASSLLSLGKTGTGVISPTKTPNKRRQTSNAYPVSDNHYSNFTTEQISVLIEQAADNDELILGPSITPRVVINMYNQNPNGKSEELLGTCQISISSLLSSGYSIQEVISKLTYTVPSSSEEASNGLTCVKAGDLTVELSFRNMKDLLAEEQSKADYYERRQRETLKKNQGTLNLTRKNSYERIAKQRKNSKNFVSIPSNEIESDLTKELDAVKSNLSKTLAEKQDAENLKIQLTKELEALKDLMKQHVANAPNETGPNAQSEDISALKLKYEHELQKMEQQLKALQEEKSNLNHILETNRKNSNKGNSEIADNMSPNIDIEMKHKEEVENLLKSQSGMQEELEQLKKQNELLKSKQIQNVSISDSNSPNSIQGGNAESILSDMLFILLQRYEKRLNLKRTKDSTTKSGAELATLVCQPLLKLISVNGSDKISIDELHDCCLDLLIECTPSQLISLCKDQQLLHDKHVVIKEFSNMLIKEMIHLLGDGPSDEVNEANGLASSTANTIKHKHSTSKDNLQVGEHEMDDKTVMTAGNSIGMVHSELDTKSLAKTPSGIPDRTAANKLETNANTPVDWSEVELPTGPDGEIIWEKRLDMKSGRVCLSFYMLIKYVL